MFEFLMDNLIQVIYLLDVVLILSMLFLERGEPSKAMLWTVILLIMPIIGFVIYLFFGQSFYSKYAFRTKIEEDQNEPIEPPADIDVSITRALDAVGSGPLSADNDVRLFTDGNEKFDSLKEDIRNARHFVHLEYYIIRKDALGDEIISLLTEKASEGVEVRLMVDALGFNTGTIGKKGLKRAGGKVAVFHSNATCLLSPKKNNRNHRKIAVIDGEIGYIGGFNIGDEYLGKGKFGHWRDSAVRITGSAVNSLSFRFNADWKYACREDITGDLEYYREESGRTDGTPVQITYGGPDVRDNPIAFQSDFPDCRVI